ncbi:MAG: DUF885 domain-containing protein [Christensenellaceae bacterium]|jgi:uncharacterized protein (DUF885 family)|nr:DUF885 domain-containing protein [Christensenellaceae bacterium]
MGFIKNKISAIFICIFICVFLTVSLIGCTDQPPVDPNPDGDSLSFSEYAEELFTLFLDGDGLSINLMLDNPEVYDFTSYNLYIATPSYDGAAVQESNNLIYLSLVEQISSYPCKTLDDEITKSLLVNTLSVYAEYNNYNFREFLGNNGVLANVPTYLEIYRFKNKNDIDLYIEYIDRLAVAFDDYLYFERFRCRNGYGRSDSFYESAITAYENIAPSDTTTANHNLTTDFSDRLADVSFELSSAEIKDFEKRNLKAVDNLLNAYKKLSTDITDLMEEFPTDTRNQGGLASVDGGADYYKSLFKLKTGSSDSIETAVSKLVTSAKTYYNQASFLYTSNIDAYLNEYYLSEANAFTEANALAINQSLMTSFADIMPGISNFPTVNINLLKSSQRTEFTSGYYVDSPIDNLNAPENIYINPDHNSSFLYSLIAHEGYPGHMYQNVYLKNNQVNNLRYVFSNVGFAEGWAVYVEELAASYISDDRTLTNAYKYSIYMEKFERALVALVDILVNYYGYSIDEVSDELSDYGLGFSEDIVKSLYDATVLLPGVYLPYAYGDIMIKEIQSTYFSNVDVFEFHQALLNIGPVDFDTLKAYILLV